MILRYSLLSFGLIAFGTVIGVILVNGPRGALDWLLDSMEPVRGFTARKAMPADGVHRTGGQARLPDLPDATPGDWTPLLGSVDDVRREHVAAPRLSGEMTTGELQALDEQVSAYLPLHDRTIKRKQVPDHPPWTGSFPAATESQVIEAGRRAWARAQLEQLGDDPTDTGVHRVYAGLRAMPASGLSFDCGNGLHAPVCDGRNCSCSCHAARVYGEAPVATVLAGEQANGLIA